MTYAIDISDRYRIYFSDTHFNYARKKPTISVYDKNRNMEMKVASFNNDESFVYLLRVLGVDEKEVKNEIDRR